MLQTKQTRDQNNKQYISAYTNKLYICIQISNDSVQSKYFDDDPIKNARIPKLYKRT